MRSDNLYKYETSPSGIPKGVPYRHMSSGNTYLHHGVATFSNDIEKLSLEKVLKSTPERTAVNLVVAHYSEDPTQQLLVGYFFVGGGIQSLQFTHEFINPLPEYDYRRMVLYSRDGVFWVRPEGMFHEEVKVDHYDYPVPRFSFTG